MHKSLSFYKKEYDLCKHAENTALIPVFKILSKVVSALFMEKKEIIVFPYRQIYAIIVVF